MTRIPRPSTHAGGARGQKARRAALRTELFRQLFLPAAEEIRDRRVLARLELPAELVLPPPASPAAERLARDRAEVSELETANHQQRQLRCLVIAMLDFMARDLLGSSDEAVLERWWSAARAYRRLLELPVMATPRARGLLPRIVGAPWPEVEKQAAAIERQWCPQPATAHSPCVPQPTTTPRGEARWPT